MKITRSLFFRAYHRLHPHRPAEAAWQLFKQDPCCSKWWKLMLEIAEIQVEDNQDFIVLAPPQ